MRTYRVETVVTDRDVQILRDKFRESGDQQTFELLQELLDWRRDGRQAVAAHDPTRYCNMGIWELQQLAKDAGCNWWQCRNKATKIRTQLAHRDEPNLYCNEHAEKGAELNLWVENSHPNDDK